MVRLSILIGCVMIIVVSIFPQLAKADESIVINECMPHPSSDKEWVELVVPTGIDIRGYWIDDDTDFVSDSGSGKKYKIDTVTAGTESAHPVVELPAAMFNNAEDYVVLFDPNGKLIDQYHYTSDPGTDITIGRYPDKTGEFSILSDATKGVANSIPLPTETTVPTPTAKPTATPEPSPTIKVPTPLLTKLPTLSPVVQTQSVKGVSTSNNSSSSMNTSAVMPTATNGAYPTPILLLSATPTPANRLIAPTGRTMVKSASRTVPIISFVGGFSLLSYAILMYLRR